MVKEILLSVENLKVYFHGAENSVAKAVDGVDFEVGREETVCLVGESGCGKTVTALSILGLINQPPGEIAGGRIFFAGQDLLQLEEEDLQHIRGNRVAMVFQEPLTSLNPVFKIGDQIEEAIRIHKKTGEDALHRRCVQLLTDVGIPSAEERLNAYPHSARGS